MPCPPPRHLPKPGMELRSPSLQADSLPSEPPGKPKNTGVGCHALLQGNFPTQELNQGLLHCRWILCELSYQFSSVAQSCPIHCDHMDCSLPSSLVHQDSPGKNPGVGCYALLQRIFPTQGSNPGLSHCTWILYHLSLQGNA